MARHLNLEEAVEGCDADYQARGVLPQARRVVSIHRGAHLHAPTVLGSTIEELCQRGRRHLSARRLRRYLTPGVVLEISLVDLSVHYIRIYWGYASGTHTVNALCEKSKTINLSCPSEAAILYQTRIQDMILRIQGYERFQNQSRLKRDNGTQSTLPIECRISGDICASVQHQQAMIFCDPGEIT